MLRVAIESMAYPASGKQRQIRHKAIENLAFKLKKAQITCILGPSGCGKTTLLNLIAGLITDYSGQIEFAPGVKEAVAYVFQTPRLLSWRSVYENIELARLSSINSIDSAGLSEQLITSVGLDKFADAYPGQLSLGMQRRVALARAFVCRPELLLMDEPFVSLDSALAEQLRALLYKMWQVYNTSILLVTHDQHEAQLLGHRLITLSAAPARIIDDVENTRPGNSS